MVHCDMCDKDVEKFKSNSHVIPKCLFKSVKENGKFTLIDNVRKINIQEQSEFKGDFICEDCENKTAHQDDKFADEFFNQNKYLLNSKNKMNINGQYIDFSKIKGLHSIEIFKNEAFIPFKNFVISIIIRYHCYLKIIKKKEFIPEHHFIALRNLYQNRNVINFNSEYPILIWKYKDNKFMYYPYHRKIVGINSQDILILGYRIHFIIDKKHSVPNSYKLFEITNNSFHCYVSEGVNQFHVSLFDEISTNETKGKLKELLNNNQRNKK